VHTRTPDGLGTDYQGVPHAKDPFGYPGLPNALIGPFYIEGTDYGDALEVHLDMVRLNRNWGWGRYRLMPSILSPNTVETLYRIAGLPMIFTMWGSRTVSGAGCRILMRRWMDSCCPVIMP